MNNEEFRKLWRTDALKEVDHEVDDSYRHGVYAYTVFQHGDDFWMASYTISGNGEEHGIRDGHFEIEKVYKTVSFNKIVDYSSVPQKPKPPTRYFRKFNEIEAFQFPGMPSSLTVDSFDDDVKALEVFEAWANLNITDAKKKSKLKYRGNKLVIVSAWDSEIIVPAGDWVICDAGSEPYSVSNENFEALFEKV